MIEHFSRDGSSGEILEVLARDGAVVVDGFLDEARVDALVSDLQPCLDAVPWCNTGANDVDEFFGHRTKRLQFGRYNDPPEEPGPSGTLCPW